MNPSRLSVPLALCLAACVKPAVEAPMEAPIAELPFASAEPLPPPDPPRDVEARFPAGPGTTLVADQFQVVLRDPRIRDRKAPFAERVALAEQSLGKGEKFSDPFSDGFVWYGVSARTMIAPFGCTEFIVSQTSSAWTVRPADHRKCGLPYATMMELTKPFNGPGPKRTTARLEEILAEAEAKPPADAVGFALMKMGTADVRGDGGESTWFGIGARGKDAPITCRALYLGGRPRIEDAPLASCDLSWPMPGMSFDPGPSTPAIDKSAKLAECSSTCRTNELCMIDQRVPYGASIRREADGERARFTDGRAAKAELVASCVPVPATCSSVNASCFFPTPGPNQPFATSNGPCPRDGYGGRAFLSAPSNHIMCFSRIGGPPLVPPPPPASAPPPKGPALSKPTPRRIGTAVDACKNGGTPGPVLGTPPWSSCHERGG